MESKSHMLVLLFNWPDKKGQVWTQPQDWFTCKPTVWSQASCLLSLCECVEVAQLCATLCDPMDYTVHGILRARILEWVAFPFSRGSSQLRDWTQAGLLHFRWILYQLSHKGSPQILEWIAYPFSSRSSWPRNQTGISCIAGRFFTNWAIWEALRRLFKWYYDYFLVF